MLNTYNDGVGGWCCIIWHIAHTASDDKGSLDGMDMLEQRSKIFIQEFVSLVLNGLTDLSEGFVRQTISRTIEIKHIPKT